VKAFEIVLVVVCAVSLIIAAAAWIRVGQLYEEIGQVGRLSLEHEAGMSDLLAGVQAEMHDLVAAIRADPGGPTAADGSGADPQRGKRPRPIDRNARAPRPSAAARSLR
jgi:hypothetical protein